MDMVMSLDMEPLATVDMLELLAMGSLDMLVLEAMVDTLVLWDIVYTESEWWKYGRVLYLWR